MPKDTKRHQNFGQNTKNEKHYPIRLGGDESNPSLEGVCPMDTDTYVNFDLPLTPKNASFIRNNRN